MRKSIILLALMGGVVACFDKKDGEAQPTEQSTDCGCNVESQAAAPTEQAAAPAAAPVEVKAEEPKHEEAPAAPAEHTEAAPATNA